MEYRFLSETLMPEQLRAMSQDELVILATEIRDCIIKVVTENGGHIGPSLGVVELTLALHSVFSTPRDKIIWDVGHQAYAHKLVTGRFGAFHTIRTQGGLSGFLKRSESIYDVFDAGHASTSISAAAGFAVSRDLQDDDYHIAAVIGDGSLTGGLAYEGLSLIGSQKRNVTVIYNDNKMSIDHNVGALSKYFNRVITDKFYWQMKAEVQKILEGFKKGTEMISFAQRVEESLKNIVINGAFFDELGFYYIGPVDGHDLKQLKEILMKVKEIKGPTVVHVLTQKGRGCPEAEADPEKYHGISPKSSKNGNITYTELFAQTLAECIREDEKIVAVTAAMPSGTGLHDIRQTFPNNYLDVGIAEEGAVVAASAMALSGLKPAVAIYSTFLQRAFDQIVHDAALQHAPVRFFIDRAGLVGEDGPTHHGVYDIAFLRMIPNMTLMEAKDSDEFAAMVRFACAFDNGPIALRYQRGEAVKPFAENVCPVEYGKAEILMKGKKVVLFAYGRMTYEAYRAALMLKGKGIVPTVVNLRFAKPLDTACVVECARKASVVVTCEYGSLQGGIGELISAVLADHAIRPMYTRHIGISDNFIEHGAQSELMRQCGLTAEDIYTTVLSCLD